MDLRGTVVLAVGPVGPIGSAGTVGTAVTARLAALGASVAVFDRRPAAVVSRIATAGGHALALTGDQCDGQSVRAAVNRLLTAWERIDILLTGVDGLAEVAPAVARYLSEAARTSARGVADLVVLGSSGSRRGQAGGRVRELRRQLAGEPVRIELVEYPPGDITGRVLELIGASVDELAGPVFHPTGRAG